MATGATEDAAVGADVDSVGAACKKVATCEGVTCRSAKEKSGALIIEETI